MPGIVLSRLRRKLHAEGNPLIGRPHPPYMSCGRTASFTGRTCNCMLSADFC